ncbi:MAG: glycosyltransferase family 4 protein [Pseudomonadota bacterium]
MRILTLTTSYPRGPLDYRGGFVAALDEALAERGHDIVTVTPGHGSLFHRDGVMETLNRHPWLATQLPPGLLRLAAGALREGPRCDAILSHWLLPCGLLGALLRRRRGPPHLLIEHGGGLRALEHLPPPAARRVLAWIAAGTDRIQAVAPWIAARLAALHPPLASRIDVDPMGVEIPEPGPPPPATPPLRVLFVGRLVPRKGVAILLEAMASTPEVSLTIVGDGPERRRLEALARPLGSRVRFLGERPPCEVPALHTSHHVIAAPSLPYPRGGEGTPTAVLAAMAAGLVPVASNTGGLADLLASGEHGLTFAPGDAAGLAVALRRLATSEETLSDRSDAARGSTRMHAWPQLAARVEARLRWARSRVA